MFRFSALSPSRLRPLLLRSSPLLRLRSHLPSAISAFTKCGASPPSSSELCAPRAERTIACSGSPPPSASFRTSPSPDITTLLLDPKAFRDTIDLFIERYRDKGINVVAGIEARGFIFGPPIALAIGAKFVPMRKPNKLPGEVISEEYSLEYGTDRMEMHVGAVRPTERVLIIDDLIATGGTLSAAIKLIERVEAEVVECACVIELHGLKGRERLGGRPLFVLVEAV